MSAANNTRSLRPAGGDVESILPSVAVVGSPIGVRALGELEDSAGPKVAGDVAQARFAIVAARVGQQQRLAVGGDVLHDALVAVVGQRPAVELSWAIPLVEERLLARG